MFELLKSDKTFEDIAGYQEEKDYVMEICDFIKNNSKYKDIGAYLPKGLLISGIPGVGKTLLVKAIINYLDIPTYQIPKEAALDEKDVLLYMKNIFEKAKQNKPSIIFIDEIDRLAIDTQENNSNSPVNQKVLNQLLVEMDGFDSSEGILVIATANYRKKLGRALLRTGRFDRQIELIPPNKEDRESIIEYYLKDKKIDQDISVDDIAIRCEKFTPSSIKTLINEASISAVYDGRESITIEDIEKARNRIIQKGIIKNKELSKKEEEIVSYHEAGHAIVSSKVAGKTLFNISLGLFGDSKGFISINNDNYNSYNRNNFEKNIEILLGGMAGELVKYKDSSFGSSEDLCEVKRILRDGIIEQGIYGIKYIVSFEEYEMISEKKIKEIEYMQNKIMKRCLRKAKMTVIRNRKTFERIAESLRNKKILYKNDIENLLN